MTTHGEAIATFLDESVNLSASRLNQLDLHVDSLWDVVRSSDKLPVAPRAWQQQGSWAYGTIIRPVKESDEFDADVVIEFEDANVAAKDYLRGIQAALEGHGTYTGKTELLTRCVRVRYAGQHHVDLVPLVERYGVLNHITNRHENSFERAEPLAYSAWFQERDDWTGGELRHVVRLLKYIRDHKQRFATKSVILTTLLASRVEGPRSFDSPAHALRDLLEELATWLERHQNKPGVPDPSCADCLGFDHRWDEAGFRGLRTAVRTEADRVRRAMDSQYPAEATKQWRLVFGPSFPEVTSVARHGRLVAGHSALDPGEETLATRQIPESIRFRAQLNARVLGRRRMNPYRLSDRGNRVMRNRMIEFTVQTDAPVGHEIYWKVKNRGLEAAEADCLRGDIVRGGATRTEPTAFRGSHYVEVYVILDGRCVAKARHPVVIT